MRPKPIISIPYQSALTQQILTPYWGANMQKPRAKNSYYLQPMLTHPPLAVPVHPPLYGIPPPLPHLYAEPPHHLYPPPPQLPYLQLTKMSRLDELLSRNQQIYQNMRNQLMEINRSNRNIDANINNIKPMYQQSVRQQKQQQDDQPEFNYGGNRNLGDNFGDYQFYNKKGTKGNIAWNQESPNSQFLQNYHTQEDNNDEYNKNLIFNQNNQYDSQQGNHRTPNNPHSKSNSSYKQLYTFQQKARNYPEGSSLGPYAGDNDAPIQYNNNSYYSGNKMLNTKSSGLKNQTRQSARVTNSSRNLNLTYGLGSQDPGTYRGSEGLNDNNKSYDDKTNYLQIHTHTHYNMYNQEKDTNRVIKTTQVYTLSKQQKKSYVVPPMEDNSGPTRSLMQKKPSKQQIPQLQPRPDKNKTKDQNSKTTNSNNLNARNNTNAKESTFYEPDSSPIQSQQYVSQEINMYAYVSPKRPVIKSIQGYREKRNTQTTQHEKQPVEAPKNQKIQTADTNNKSRIKKQNIYLNNPASVQPQTETPYKNLPVQTPKLNPNIKITTYSANKLKDEQKEGQGYRVINIRSSYKQRQEGQFRRREGVSEQDTLNENFQQNNQQDTFQQNPKPQKLKFDNNSNRKNTPIVIKNYSQQQLQQGDSSLTYKQYVNIKRIPIKPSNSRVTIRKSQQFPVNQSMIQKNQNLSSEYDFLNPNTTHKQVKHENPVPMSLSLLFIPFNRLYSSPILQQTSKKQLILAHKSKTYPSQAHNPLTNKILHGKKYKNVNVVNQEKILYEIVMEFIRNAQQGLRIQRAYNRKNISTQGKQQRQAQIKKESVDVCIVGGQNCLKKKLHYALIAHLYTSIVETCKVYFNNENNNSGNYAHSREPEYNHNNSQAIGQPEQNTFLQKQNSENNMSQNNIKHYQNLKIYIEHQQMQNPNGQPYIVRYQGEIMDDQVQNQIVYGNVRAVISTIFQVMKNKTGSIYPTPTPQTTPKIRVTKLSLQTCPTQSQEDPIPLPTTLLDVKIISTNKINSQFIYSLEPNLVIWCANPLFKYYDQTEIVLGCYKLYRELEVGRGERAGSSYGGRKWDHGGSNIKESQYEHSNMNNTVLISNADITSYSNPRSNNKSSNISAQKSRQKQKISINQITGSRISTQKQNNITNTNTNTNKNRNKNNTKQPNPQNQQQNTKSKKTNIGNRNRNNINNNINASNPAT